MTFLTRYNSSRVAAVVEVVVVLAVAIIGSSVVSRVIQRPAVAGVSSAETSASLTRWVVLVAVMLTIDFFARRRTPAEWGIVRNVSVVDVLWQTAALLMLGGFLPLLLALLLPPSPALGSAALSIVASLLGPLVGQELFVFGYGYRRLRDAYTPRSATLVATILVLLAHASHAGKGVVEWTFLAAIAWQAVVWSAAREAGTALWPLMGAHLALLVAYQSPRVGLVAIAVVGIPALFRSRAWYKSLRAAMN